MPATEQVIHSKVCQWITFADDDLRLALHGLTLGEQAPYRLIAYHAQQCVEKYLKAYLVFSSVDFPYTHNLSRLIELLQQIRHWPEVLLETELLTPYAVTARYPGDDEPVSAEEAHQAIAIARQTSRIVLAALEEAGFVPPPKGW